MISALLAAASWPGSRAAGPSDSELVDRFKGGERRAFHEIVVRYQDRVYTLCYRWLGDAPLAEETAQDVFLALFKSLGGFRGDAQLSTWIFKVTLNHCRNRRLHRSRRGFGRTESLGPRPEEEGPERQIADEGPGADAGTDAREAQALVSAALERLDEDHRQILILRDVEDLSYEEIADILELPRGTVKSRIHRARAELAAVLARRIGPEDVR
jgi:RNA polymerase sigma-70 factor (ECF subfamily)